LRRQSDEGELMASGGSFRRVPRSATRVIAGKPTQIDAALSVLPGRMCRRSHA